MVNILHIFNCGGRCRQKHFVRGNTSYDGVSVEVTDSRTHYVVVGNREWMQRHDLVIPDDVHKSLEQHENKGQLTALCAVDGGYAV